MQLTTEQLEAIDAGEAIAVEVDDRRCIVVREDFYEQRLSKNASRLSDEAVGALVHEAMAEYDEGDPLLESYQQVD